MYNMHQFNLLDLDNDLYIIGDYVKKDNKTRNENERKREKEFVFKGTDNNIQFLIKINNFDINQVNNIVTDLINDGVLTFDECQKYADTVEERIFNVLNFD
jgi:hypothetical protein